MLSPFNALLDLPWFVCLGLILALPPLALVVVSTISTRDFPFPRSRSGGERSALLLRLRAIYV